MNENKSCRFKMRAAAMAVASCLTFLPWAAQAASLGKLTVYSALGQPLRAEAEITGEKDEFAGMTARLAPLDVFRQAGVDYALALNDLRFSIERKASGRAVLKVSSLRPVNEPFLDFLIELNWPAGKVVREYTFLLDPPEMAPKQGAKGGAEARLVETVRGGGGEAERPAQAARQVPASTAPVQAKPAAEKPAAEKPKAEKPKASAGEYVVERGDTLRKIAAETQYEGVSLEQMLVGLYRNNRDAFFGNDINRLKTGAILNLPEKSAVEAISEKDTRNIYVRTGDFGAYRNKLAAAAKQGAASESAPAQQQAAGRITPKVEEKSPVVDPAKDQVKVAKPDAASKASAAAEADRIAREKALQEAQERLSLLEKNVGELQKLLEMKNQRLAELEKAPPPAVSPPPAVAKPLDPPREAPVAVTEPPAPVVPVQEKPAEAPVPAEKPADSKPPQAVKPPPPPVVEEPSLLDGLLEDPLPLAGGAGALALLAGLLIYRRRKAGAADMPETTTLPSPSGLGPNSVFRMTGGQSVDTGNTPPQTGEFSQAGPGTIDTDEVDPVAEADVYMAYGRDAQAEEILLEALQKDPQRLAIHAKLLEIYANRRSLKQFETLASELYAQTGGAGPEWAKVAALGLGLDPHNPLYRPRATGGGEETLVASSAAAAAAMAAAQALASQPEPVAEVLPVAEVAPLPDFELPEAGSAQFAESVDTSGLTVGEPEVAVDPMSLDFDFDASSVADVAAEAQPADEPEPAIGDEPYVSTVVTGEAPAAPVEPEPVEAADAGLDALDFDLSGLVAGEALAAPAEPAASAPDDVAQFVPVAADDVAHDMALDLPVDAPLGVTVEEALPDFSPEGTLVMPSAMSDSQMEAFGLSASAIEPLAEVRSAVEPLPEPLADRSLEPSPVDFADEPEVPASALQTVVNTPVSQMAVDDLDFEQSDMVNTVVNPPLQAEAPAGDDVDFDVKLSDSVFLGQPMVPSDFDIGSINLDLSAPQAALDEAPAAQPAAVERDAHWEEINTKLDLAKAYEDMGDQEGARELLQEVVAEGSEDLVAQARDILARIGG